MLVTTKINNVDERQLSSIFNLDFKMLLAQKKAHQPSSIRKEAATLHVYYR